MARKLDGRATTARGALTLPYEDDVVTSLVRVISVWTSSAYQQQLAQSSALPNDENAIPAIYRLAAVGAQRPSALAADLHISAAATSRLLDRLAASGLTQRVADPHDSRASLVTLTDAGAAQARDLFLAGDGLMNQLLQSWTDRDRELLARLMHRLADAVENDAATRGTPTTNKQGT